MAGGLLVRPDAAAAATEKKGKKLVKFRQKYKKKLLFANYSKIPFGQPTQCGNVRIFLSYIFHVKSI